MVSTDEIKGIQGGKALDSDGNKIGSIGQIYLDDRSGNPAWATVNTGLFGTSESFIPLQDARVEGQDVKFPYTKDKVKDAPRVDADQHLDVDQEQELYRYYGVSYDGDRSNDHDGQRAAAGTAAVGTQTQGGRRDGDVDDRTGHVDQDHDHDHDAVGNDGTVTRHEERLNVGTETRETGRARLRKYVTTEEQTVSVPVSREEVRVERVPVAEGTPVGDDAFQEGEQNVTLHEEVPVVQKETHAVEGVRLSTEQVSGEQQVTEQVRQEHIEVEGDGVRDGDNRRDENRRDDDRH